VRELACRSALTSSLRRRESHAGLAVLIVHGERASNLARVRDELTVNRVDLVPGVQGVAETSGREGPRAIGWYAARIRISTTGRARTVPEAIAAHQNQAVDVRNAYFALTSAEQNAIQKFLRR